MTDEDQDIAAEVEAMLRDGLIPPITLARLVVTP